MIEIPCLYTKIKVKILSHCSSSCCSNSEVHSEKKDKKNLAQSCYNWVTKYHSILFLILHALADKDTSMEDRLVDAALGRVEPKLKEKVREMVAECIKKLIQ